MVQYLKYLAYLQSNREVLFQEYKRDGELKSLMQDEKITTMFQPILELEEGGTVGFEILNRPKTTRLFPTTEKFYDYVGKSHHVFMAESFLRNLSLKRHSGQLQSTPCHKDKWVFLNIQPQVLADPAYQSGKTLELLSLYNLSPDQIVLELTEKEAVIDYGQFKKIVEHYRSQGFRIAVDDAGTGYNSLKTLAYLKPEFIKIDKSLVCDIDKFQTKQHLVKLLLDFALQSETKVIAEGIETMAELAFLKEQGIHFGQGYCLGKPAPTLTEGRMPRVNPILKKYFA